MNRVKRKIKLMKEVDRILRSGRTKLFEYPNYKEKKGRDWEAVVAKNKAVMMNQEAQLEKLKNERKR